MDTQEGSDEMVESHWTLSPAATVTNDEAQKKAWATQVLPKVLEAQGSAISNTAHRPPWTLPPAHPPLYLLGIVSLQRSLPFLLITGQ